MVIVEVGYNDTSDVYADAMPHVMGALEGAGVRVVVWVTLVEQIDGWAIINQLIRNAPARWPRLVVADWAAVAADHPAWFAEGPHLTAEGGMAFARFLRDAVLGACGAPCATAVEQPAPPPDEAALPVEVF